MQKQEKTKPCASGEITARLEQKTGLKKPGSPIVEHCLRSVKEVFHA